MIKSCVPKIKSLRARKKFQFLRFSSKVSKQKSLINKWISKSTWNMGENANFKEEMKKPVLKIVKGE